MTHGLVQDVIVGLRGAGRPRPRPRVAEAHGVAGGEVGGVGGGLGGGAGRGGGGRGLRVSAAHVPAAAAAAPVRLLLLDVRHGGAPARGRAPLARGPHGGGVGGGVVLGAEPLAVLLRQPRLVLC